MRREGNHHCQGCTSIVQARLWEDYNPPEPPLPALLRSHWEALCGQVGKVKEGELFRVETIDWTGGQIKDDDSADDVKNIDLTQARSVW